MIKRLKGIFGIKDGINKGDPPIKDYTPLLRLVPIKHKPYEEFYQRYYHSGLKFLEVPLSLRTEEPRLIEKFGTEFQSKQESKLVHAALEREVGKILDDFHQEVLDSGATSISYYPLDTVEYVNTTSEGWYLLKEGSTFTMYCTYKLWKEI